VFDGYLPDNFNDVKAYFEKFFSLFFDKENFVTWLNESSDTLLVILEIVVLMLPLFIALGFVIKKLYRQPNNDYNEDTKQLVQFKKFSKLFIAPVFGFIKQYCEYVKSQKWFWISWLVIWAFNLNIVSIVVAFFAYYFYFSVSFDLGGLFIQFAKLVVDLQVIIKYVPIPVFIILGLVIFGIIRKKMALAKLRHFEARNCGFINDLPIVSMSCGSMGKKKTTLITDMALSQEVMFRQEAFSRLQKADMKFPNFPWVMFENEIKACMEHKTIYNLASIKKWIELKRSRFEKNNSLNQVYNYDIDKYGLFFNNGLKTEFLFDVLSSYAQLYFIYVIESSLLIGNYSIREDNSKIDEGNFPIWLLDFFSCGGKRDSRHSHILDFDVLRLGKKVVEDNEKNGSFEFGIISITEIGKERGNNLELKEVKKSKEETNQKNDLFNSWLKMCRHSATVDNFPFIKVFTDEQRPESWGADARDLCDIVHIVSSGDQKLALPFYTIEEMLTEWAFNKFIDFYYDLRFYRGDNTLLIYLLKKCSSFLYKRNIQFYNLYGYSVLFIEKERGTQDGKLEKKKYYLSSQKIYNQRFKTDCFSDYFNDMAIRTKIGLMDYVEYESEKASISELKMQNSYFINSLYKEDDSEELH